MKFIRDIIGEKQIQSKEPREALFDPEIELEDEMEDDTEWMLPPIDLADELDEDLPDLHADPMDHLSMEEPADQPALPPSRQRPAVAPEASVIRRALWQEEVEPEFELQEEAADSAPEPPRFGRQAYLDAIPEVPAEPDPAPPAAEPQGGRVKTRLLGFGGDMAFPADPIQQPGRTPADTAPGFPVGWLVIVSGPGRGASFTLQAGVAQIGRGEGQAIRLDFGDTSISRENHAAIAFDPERNAFFIGHGGKANLVRCNDMPVLATQELSAGDRLRIGETTLIFTPLCGPGFSWAPEA